MRYEPKMLINRTSHVVRFQVCGIDNKKREIVFKKGEKKILDGWEANHALKEVNTGLEEYTEEIAKEVAGDEKVPDYSKLPWTKLVKKLGKDFEPGMNKAQVIKALEDRWEKRHGKKS